MFLLRPVDHLSIIFRRVHFRMKFLEAGVRQYKTKRCRASV
jgi:hypothetical protein